MEIPSNASNKDLLDTKVKDNWYILWEVMVNHFLI